MSAFRSVWVVDFEYYCPAGHTPRPLCMVARDAVSGDELALGEAELLRANAAPFDTGASSLVVAYHAPAEMSCFLALGWRLPDRVLDLCAEFKLVTNRGDKARPAAGRGLLGACSYYGIPAMVGTEKSGMRALAMRGGSYSMLEMADLLSYCGEDVGQTVSLYRRMLPAIDWPAALRRGSYGKAVAVMERRGVPVDVDLHDRMIRHWDAIRAQLIADVDRDFGVYEGGSFRQVRFGAYLRRRGIAWPRLESGALDLKDSTFKAMAAAHVEIEPMHQLRTALSEMRQGALPIGPDGRNRSMLSPFSTLTGRNAPRSSEFIFGRSAWQRSLIRPAPGRALAYVDWAQEEFAVAAVLSRDPTMLEAYLSGDPYLAFAKQAGAVPSGATKDSHAEARDRYKVAALAVQYGMGSKSLAIRAGISEFAAAQLLRDHRTVYARYWQWSDDEVDRALMSGRISTHTRWSATVAGESNMRSLANFPIQATGAELMRLAAVLLCRDGVEVCCPVHDAFLIEADDDAIDEAAAATQSAMAEASRALLGGVELRSDVKIVRARERYCDKRGAAMFRRVQELVEAAGA